VRRAYLSAAIAGSIIAVGVAACRGIGVDEVCAGVGYYPLQVRITNDQGEGLAFGSIVTLTDGSYLEIDSSRYDPAVVWAADSRGGRTYDVTVSRRWYNDVTVRGVRVPGGGCVTRAPDPALVNVTLRVQAGAPEIRAVAVRPPSILLDRARTEAYAFVPYVDADAGVSRSVAWSIHGDTASVSFDAPTGTLHYKCRAISGKLVIVARSLVDAKIADSATVAVQGHPASSTDPPCA